MLNARNVPLLIKYLYVEAVTIKDICFIGHNYFVVWICFCAGTENNWKFDVTFNHLGGGSEVIKFGISNLQVYVTP